MQVKIFKNKIILLLKIFHPLYKKNKKTFKDEIIL